MPCALSPAHTGHLPTRLLAAIALCALPLFATLAQGTDTAGQVRTALLNGDHVSARGFLEGVTSSTEREHLTRLIAESEAHTLADEVTRTLSTSSARVAVQALAARMPALEATLPGDSPSLLRLVALRVLANQLADAEPREPVGLPPDIQQALAMGVRELAGLATRRTAHRATIAAAHQEATRLVAVVVDVAGRDRVTDAQTAYAALEKQLAELGTHIEAADLLFEAAEANQARADAKALVLTSIEEAGVAICSMYYFMRNFGDGRKAVESALALVPTSRRLLDIKVKIEEWQSRQRIWGDTPGR